MGFCAEHSAIAAMITDGETVIEKIVSISIEILKRKNKSYR